MDAIYDRAGHHPVKTAAKIFTTRGGFMTFASRLAAATLAAMLCGLVPASAQQPIPQAPAPQQPAPPPPPRAQPGPDTFGPDELLGAGHKFFGNVSRGLASVIERAVSQWGLPNGYVLGEEAGGAFFGGLRRKRLGIRYDRGGLSPATPSLAGMTNEVIR